MIGPILHVRITRGDVLVEGDLKDTENGIALGRGHQTSDFSVMPTEKSRGDNVHFR